jgi:UDP-glucose 4-epimerase
MRVVITGASGFLGSAVLKKLTIAGLDAVGVSRKKTPGLLQVDKYSDSPSGDVLIHLAENNNRTRVNQLSATYEQEACSTLDALLKKGYGMAIYASTSVLYGDGVRTPHSELDPVTPVDTYTRSKMAAEQRVLSLGGTVARLANIYGLGMARENVLSHILRQIRNDGSFTLQDATPVRDFLWIDDAAEAIIKMVALQAQGVFNIGTGIGTSIGELASMLLAHAKVTKREIVSLQSATKQSCIVLDITKAKQELHWQPYVVLNEGLRLLVSN